MPASLFSSLNFSQFRVNNLPSFVFLCGGSIKRRTNLRVYDSIRDFVAKQIKQNDVDLHRKIFMAEDINDWYRENYYNDLLTFEKDIAGLAAIIVIFVESAGAIAELGSFSSLNTVKDKLLVFVESRNYHEKESFIKLGPLKHLENIKDDYVSVLPWSYKNNNKIDLWNPGDNYRTIEESIKSRIAALPSSICFKKEDTIHLTLLAFDIIELLKIARLDDISEAFSQIGIPRRKLDIRKFIFILEKLKFITKYKYSKHTFYIPVQKKQFIDLSFKSTSSFKIRNRIDFQILIDDSRKTNQTSLLQPALEAYTRDIL